MANEPMPAKEFVDELNSQWNSSNVTEPNYLVVTGANEQIRYDLNRGDYIIARPGTIQEIPIGNYKYADRVYDVDLEIYTNNSSENVNVWSGTIDIELLNSAILLESS